MTNPQISVLLPVYNGEQHLAEAIDSILAQTFSDFEFIIIDDGSSDGTLAILQSYQALDSRIRLISRNNKGLVATLNEGIDLAYGEWLVRMDADDIALPHRFARQLQHLGQTGADLCGSWVQFFGSSDQRILKHPQSDAAIKMALLFGSAFAHPSVMIKTALIKKLRYDSAWENAEDYDLWIRAARAGWQMTNVPEVLLYYRQHNSQISKHATLQQQARTQEIRRRYCYSLSGVMGLKPQWIDEVLKMRETSFFSVDMDTVDMMFGTLLQQNQGEAKAVIFDHITRLYCRVAGCCPDIVTRWSRLNKQFGGNFALGTICKLWLLNRFHINADSSLFHRLKNFYFHCLAWYQAR